MIHDVTQLAIPLNDRAELPLQMLVDKNFQEIKNDLALLQELQLHETHEQF
jgi:hypothetical protein